MNAAESDQRPLILVGTGRCGSTLLHRLLAEHPQLGWISTVNEIFPALPRLALASRLYRAPLPVGVRTWRAYPKPFEAYRFWEHYLPGFSRRDHAPTADDVPREGVAPVRAATARILRAQGRSRLLVKVTGWSRIAYFDRIYPDARFVSLRRDPRSVVSSWVQAGWLDVTSSPDSSGWQWGVVPEAQLEAWRELGGGALLSAALKIRMDLDDIAANVARLPERCLEVSYEQLITEPEATLRTICDFAALDWAPEFERMIKEREFYDSRGTWRRHLSETDGELVLEFMRRTESQPSRAASSSSAQR